MTVYPCERIAAANLTAFQRSLGAAVGRTFAEYGEFWRFSVDRPEVFWRHWLDAPDLAALGAMARPAWAQDFDGGYSFEYFLPTRRAEQALVDRCPSRCNG